MNMELIGYCGLDVCRDVYGHVALDMCQDDLDPSMEWKNGLIGNWIFNWNFSISFCDCFCI